MSRKIKKKELGKGIRALLSTMEEQKEMDREDLVRQLSSSVEMIPVEDIEVNPFQPRKEFEEESMEELAQSIRTHGIIQPVTVRHIGGNKYQIITGERRLRASRMVGLEEIPAYVRIADDQGMLEMALIENIQRKNLNPIEIAITYKRLMDECDLTHEALAGRISKKRSTVSNYVRLLKLPPVIQQALKDEKLSMGHARALVGISNIAVQLEVFHRILEKGLSVRAVEEYLRTLERTRGRKKQTSTNQDPNIAFLENRISNTLGAKVSLTQNKNGSGRIVIRYNSTKELNQIIDNIHDKANGED